MAIALCIAPLAIAQDSSPAASLSASLSPAEIPYHRTANYTLRIEAPKGEAFEFPEFESSNPDLIIRKGELRSTENETTQSLEQDYLLDAIRPGVYLIPGQQLSFGDTTLTVPPTTLSVRDLTEQEMAAAGEFEGLPGVEAIAPTAAIPWWYYPLGAAAIACIVALLAYIWIERRRPAPLPPPEPAWIVAQRRLAELASRKLPEAGKFEAYYVDLSAILRYYIEDRFGIRAPEQTTPEFLESAGKSGRLSDSQQESLSHLLRHCDRVKFARYEPTLSEMQESFEVVTTFVRETVPSVEPEARAAA